MSKENPLPGEFDFYILAQSWSPSFCCKNPKRCATINLEWSRTHLCLHGVWPSYLRQIDGRSFPSNCENKLKFFSNNIPPLALEYAPSYHGGLGKHGNNGKSMDLAADCLLMNILKNL
eukprot:maker-scaffold_11-snap-gene-2.33-mRNA-1 protein AED:0.20 eAED:0.20 QI:213/0.5/0.33/1/1/1/3/0/117